MSDTTPPSIIDALAKRKDFEQVFRLFDLLVQTPPLPENNKRREAAYKELRKLLGEKAYADFCATFRL